MEQETTIWEDSPSHYINLQYYASCTLFAVTWIFVSIFYQNQLIQKQADDGSNDPIPASFFIIMLVGLMLPIVFALWKAWQIRSVHYALTTQRLIVSKGIFTRRIDELELYRVKDYRIEQPFFYRLFGIGTIILETSDQSDHTLWLKAINHPEQVRDQIRTHVEERRNQGGRVSQIEIS